MLPSSDVQPGVVPADVHEERTCSVAQDPVVLVMGLGVIGLLAIGVHLAGIPLPFRVQHIAAGVVVLFFLVSTLLSPANGLVLLYLVPPLFNGEDKRPYFSLLEVLVYLTLLVGFGTRLWRRERLVFPYAPLVLLFLVSTVISFPLNLKEMWLEFQVSPWREVLEGIRRADLWENLFYVRTVLNVASGIGLYVLVVNEPWPRKRLVRVAAAATVVYTTVTVLGLWRYWAPFAPGQTFLTLWLGGDAMGGFQGLGFNVGYFAQYALAYLPLLALGLIESTPRWATAVAGCGLLLSAYTIVATYQKAAHFVFLLELVVLLVAGAMWWKGEQRVGRGRLMFGIGALAVILAGLLTFTTMGSKALTKLLDLWQHGDLYRVNVLSVAWRMFLEEPLLGIGSGRFAHMFSRYNPDPGMQWGFLSAHNLYAQFLAEQGALGLVSFLALVTAIVTPAIRRVRQLTEERTALFFLLMSMGAWLVYGCFQYTVLMRSMQVYFWITLGLLVVLARGASSHRISIPWLAVIAAVLAVTTLRIDAVLRRPVPIGYAWGLHAGDVREARWTRGGAVLNLPVQGKVLTLAFAFPVPQISEPQRVTVLVDGVQFRQIVLRPSPSTWEIVEIPVDKAAGAPLLVQVRVAYFIVPEKLFGSSDRRRYGVLMRPLSWR
jgi:O-antigen ligase